MMNGMETTLKRSTHDVLNGTFNDMPQIGEK